MNYKKHAYLWWGVGGVVVVGALFLLNTSTPGKLDAFTQCVAESGATFYGAFWCPHCNDQKAMFGKSAKLLPYVECSTPDGKGMLEICSEIGIESYPTWAFPDGERLTGSVPLATIAERTGCVLP